jgi:hypothetical protein
VLKSASTILTLLRFLRNWKITNTSTGESQYLSRAVVAQLIIIVKDGIRAAERDLLSSLHQHIYGIKGPGQKNMIPLWIALWALMTTYRNCMIYYKEFSKYRKVALEHDPAGMSQIVLIISLQLTHDRHRYIDRGFEVHVPCLDLYLCSSLPYFDTTVSRLASREEFRAVGSERGFEEGFRGIEDRDLVAL